MDSRSWGMLARFEIKRRGYPLYPHILPLSHGHDQREIAVTLTRNAGHALGEITGHDGAKNAHGLHKYHTALRTLAECRDTGKWPAYQPTGQIESIDLPHWAK